MKPRVLFALAVLVLACQKSKETPTDETRYFDALEANDTKLPTPAPGDWLYDHPEKGQTFVQYKRKVSVPDVHLTRIYLMPIGSFTKEQQAVMEQVRLYASRYFQRDVVMMPTLSDSGIPQSKRRPRDFGEQWLSPYIIDSIVKGRRPADALACMAFTSGDLYPSDDWNFVFGQASYAERVGVTSIFRLKFPPQRAHDQHFFLRRLMNVTTHEIGHMLQMAHCTHALCVMNGSNGMAETDASPNRACSECQRKLHWRLGYDNQKRLKELIDFFSKYRLSDDLSRAEEDAEALP